MPRTIIDRLSQLVNTDLPYEFSQFQTVLLQLNSAPGGLIAPSVMDVNAASNASELIKTLSVPEALSLFFQIHTLRNLALPIIAIQKSINLDSDSVIRNSVREGGPL